MHLDGGVIKFQLIAMHIYNFLFEPIVFPAFKAS